MIQRVFGLRAAVTLAGVFLATAAAAQSTDLDEYALIALTSIGADGAVINGGDAVVLSPAGIFTNKGALAAGGSELSADSVSLSGQAECASVRTNDLQASSPTCNNPLPFSPPFPDVATTCGHPSPFPACDPDNPITITSGDTLALPPGVYGDVILDVNPGFPSTLELGGTYTFCSLEVRRDARVRFTEPSTVRIAGNAFFSNGTVTGPAHFSGLTAHEIMLHVGGAAVEVAKNGSLTALVCAPDARFGADAGALLDGRFMADVIDLNGSTVNASLPPTSTTSTSTSTSSSVTTSFTTSTSTSTSVSSSTSTSVTTSTSSSTTTSTSSTTIPPTCLDGELNGSESDVDCGGDICPTCDDGEDCNENSDCTSGVCQDGVCQAPTCSDGVTNGVETDVDCGGGTCPACDDGDDCVLPSDCTSGVCEDGTCIPAACNDGLMNGNESDTDCGGDVCPGCEEGEDCRENADCLSNRCLDGVCGPYIELCGNCLDDDFNGLVDFEDPACCGEQFSGRIRRGNLKPKKDGKLRMNLRTALGAGGLFVDPPVEEVGLILRTDEEPFVLCSLAEAGLFELRGKKFKFKKKKGNELASGLWRMTIRQRDDGELRYRAYGRRINWGFGRGSDSPKRTVHMTVGFRDPNGGELTNRCITIVDEFRRGKHSQSYRLNRLAQ